MLAQYAQASLVSQSKRLAVPASVDSVPTSAMQEDHVSMGWDAARKLRATLGPPARRPGRGAGGGGEGYRACAPLGAGPGHRGGYRGACADGYPARARTGSSPPSSLWPVGSWAPAVL